MKTKYLSSLLLLVVACSGGQTTGGADDGGATKQELKKKAANAHAEPTAPSADVCAEQGWYHDGECDNFCQDADTADCTPNSGGVVCALFIELPDGVCKRPANDPCISQDPDCGAQPTEPSDPVVCTLVAQLPDGVCKDDPADPCDQIQDLDCNAGSTPGNPGGGNSAPGSTPTEPSDPGEPVICPDIAQLPDGVCHTDSKDVCDFYQDPDCMKQTEPAGPGVACDLYIEQPDKVCKRPPTDPCIFQDPDCTKN